MSAALRQRVAALTRQQTQSTAPQVDVPPCAVDWCTRQGNLLCSGSGNCVRVCSTHAPWFRPRRDNSKDGFRIGHLAAAQVLDAYAFGQVPDHSLSASGHFEHHCPHCGALHFTAECVRTSSGAKAFSLCCRHGALADLPLLEPAPPVLAALLGPVGGHPDAADFQANIRSYNGRIVL